MFWRSAPQPDAGAPNDPPRRPRIGRAARSLSLVGLVTLLAPAACRTVMESPRTQSQQAIQQALRERGDVAVMVALVEPPGFSDPSQTASSRAAIARMQDEVVAALDTADFRETKRFAALPALAGILKTERGLRILMGLPQVRELSLDTGGGGGS